MTQHQRADTSDNHARCACGATSSTPLPAGLRTSWHAAHLTDLPATDLPSDGLSGRQAAEAIGCTYRQIDYWARTGVLVPTRPAAGSGSRRRYTAADITLGRCIVHLAAAGGLEAAKDVTNELRQLLATDQPPPGVFIRSTDHTITTTPPSDAAWWVPLPAAA